MERTGTTAGGGVQRFSGTDGGHVCLCWSAGRKPGAEEVDGKGDRRGGSDAVSFRGGSRGCCGSSNIF